MAYGGVAAESPRALLVPPGFGAFPLYAYSAPNPDLIITDTTPDNKGITITISPKRWTLAQLAACLGGEAGAWTVRRGAGGRAFMRMGEEELGRHGYVFSSSFPDVTLSPLTVSLLRLLPRSMIRFLRSTWVSCVGISRPVWGRPHARTRVAILAQRY
ncbi:hypothetical protein C8J57DRAFT_1306461 [Mycena rebaudengoi]|nr:hypothetical protein C8J57DRAFT_1306461 [Mycena rebaudengoi]